MRTETTFTHTLFVSSDADLGKQAERFCKSGGPHYLGWSRQTTAQITKPCLVSITIKLASLEETNRLYRESV